MPTTAVQRAESTAIQVHSLTHRNRFADAVALGVASLLAATRMIGARVPGAFFVPDDFALLLWLTLKAPRIWLAHGPARSLARPASPQTRRRALRPLLGKTQCGDERCQQDAQPVRPRAAHGAVVLGGFVWTPPSGPGVRHSHDGLVSTRSAGAVAGTRVAHSRDGWSMVTSCG